MATMDDDNSDNDTGGEVIDMEDGDSSGGSKDREDRGDVLSADDDGGAPEPGDKADDKADDKPEDRQSDQQRIPKARFNEVNEARKDAERQLAEAQEMIRKLQQGQATTAQASSDSPPAPKFDVAAKEDEYIEAMMDGDKDRAKAIRLEINEHIQRQAEDAADRRLSQRAQANDLQAVSDQAVKDYPYLDTPAGAEALQLIIMRRDTLIGQGIKPAEALSRAVSLIAPKFSPEDDDTPGRGSTGEPSRVDTRIARAIQRGTADSSSQPATLTAGVGSRVTAGRVNVEQMDEDQFRSLSSAEKRKLRGD